MEQAEQQRCKLSQNPANRPKTPATMVCPSAAAHSVEITRPTPVAAKITGTTIPAAVAGTYPTSENASASDPTAKIGNPRICGLPAEKPVIAAAGSAGMAIVGPAAPAG